MDASFVNTLQDKIFYYYPQNGHDRHGQPVYDEGRWIAAKLLFINGAAIPDPNAGRSNMPNMYSRLNANGQIDESSALAGQYKDALQNYILVPANYSPAEAEAFAEQVNGMLPDAAKKAMRAAFVDGGSQDLQRGEEWGIPKGEVGGAFKDAASWNLGFITEQTYIPNIFAEIEGGKLAQKNYRDRKNKHENGTQPNGPHGMDQGDYNDFLAGLNAAKAAGFSGSPLDYFKQLRKHILGNSKTSSNTLLDHALAVGQAGLGGFAPMGRVAPPHAGAVRQRSGGIGEATGLQGQSAGAAHGEVLASGGQAPGASGYKAMLAQAKAQAALARQSRMAAGNAGYLAPAPSGLSNVSFAPIGAGGLGPAARFAARAGGLAQPNALHPGETADMSADRLIPSTASHSMADASTLPALGDAASASPAPADFGRALENYFFRQSRLPPAGGAAFNPYLSPVWAGLKLPG